MKSNAARCLLYWIQKTDKFSQLVPLVFFCVFAFNAVSAQVTIVSANLQPYSVSAHSLCNITLFNSGQAQQVMLDARLSNAYGEPLLNVKSNPFLINSGVNVVSEIGITLTEVVYGNSNVANYIQTLHILPTGRYQYCCYVVQNETEGGDEFCDIIESDINSFMNLVTPYDGDTLDPGDPLLVWNHSEPFTVLDYGQFFRIVVSEMETGQTADAAVMNNLPVFYKDFVNAHQVQYPPDASDLEPGKSYGWQVQKIDNGNITSRTEAWTFTIRADGEKGDIKYAVLKRTLDGTNYTAINNKIYFVFTEDYHSTGLDYKILNQKQEVVWAEIFGDMEENNSHQSMMKVGYNRYVIDLSSASLLSGYYLLEVFNAKHEKFLMSFYVQ